MPRAVSSNSLTIQGLQFPNVLTVDEDGCIFKDVSVSAAKTGSLTTRTNNTEGTLTMANDHGITTGARLDLYWSGGSRRGITVGTVSVNSVPLTDTGAGDNLPAQSTAITAMVPREEAFPVEGDDAVVIAMFSDQLGTFVLAESDDSESLAATIGGAAGTTQSYQWLAASGVTNPIAGETVTKVFISHGSATSTATMRVAVMFE